MNTYLFSSLLAVTRLGEPRRVVPLPATADYASGDGARQKHREADYHVVTCPTHPTGESRKGPMP